MRHPRVLIVAGTRPEVIKLAPVYRAFEQDAPACEVRILVTGQHRGLLDRALADFSLSPHYDLDVMRVDQDAYYTVSAVLKGMRDVLAAYEPDCIVVQGDTTTTFAAALAAFYRKSLVAHVEAGLRTGDKYAPFPEEVNRRLVTSLADVHYAPTDRARDNLLREGIDASDVLVTGNTGIDSLNWVIKNRKPGFAAGLADRTRLAIAGQYLLLTMHRKESFGSPMAEALMALKDLISMFPGLQVVFPVHPNPNVRLAVDQILGEDDSFHLIEPQSYVDFAHLMANAKLILTDSGGVQEEAPSLSVPVLVLRDTTERPEGVEAGVAILTGTKRDRIQREVSRLLGDQAVYRSMIGRASPYGDGKAAYRVATDLSARLSGRERIV